MDRQDRPGRHDPGPALRNSGCVRHTIQLLCNKRDGSNERRAVRQQEPGDKAEAHDRQHHGRAPAERKCGNHDDADRIGDFERQGRRGRRNAFADRRRSDRDVLLFYHRRAPPGRIAHGSCERAGALMLYDEAVDPKTGDLMFNADAGAYSDYINDGGIVAGKDQVRQNIEDRLRMVYGEWFLNTEIGVPWFDKVLVKNPDLSAIDIILKSTILDTIEVTELLAYKSAL